MAYRVQRNGSVECDTAEEAHELSRLMAPIFAIELPQPPGVKPMVPDVLQCSATSTGLGEERRCQLAHQHEGEHVSGTWSWRVDPDIRISCRMCLDEHESFIPMDWAKGKVPCPRCNQNLADAIVLDELSTKTGFRTCLHARGQGTADTCVEPEGHPGMHSNGSGGFWAKGA